MEQRKGEIEKGEMLFFAELENMKLREFMSTLSNEQHFYFAFMYAYKA